MDESFTDLSPCTFRLSNNTGRSHMCSPRTRSGTHQRRDINDQCRRVANIMFRVWFSVVHMDWQCQPELWSVISKHKL